MDGTSGATGAPAGVSDHARRVWRDAVTIDMHNDLPSKLLDEGYDAGVRHPAGFEPGRTGHTDLPRLVESGLTAVFLAAFVDAPFARAHPDGSFARACAGIEAIHGFVARHPDRLLPAATAADVRRAKREGKVAILVAVEGGHAIEGSLDHLRGLHARGARYLTLTWNNGNEWAGSSIGQGNTRTGGLTDFGREVIREMHRLGMLVDVSHVSDATLADVLAVAAAPVIASHSSARAIAPHPRNLADDQLRAVAAAGGVVNVNFFSRFVDPAYLAAWQAMERRLATRHPRSADDAAAARLAFLDARRRAAASLPATPLAVLVDHLEHVARVAGIDHVGIGSDFDGVSALPEGMADVAALPRLAQALLDRGWADEAIGKALGGNMLRVMERVIG